MIDLLRAESRKVTTTKLWWGMLLGAVGLVALVVVGQIAGNGARGRVSLPLAAAATQKTIAASASIGYLFALVVGIILITTEFRHFTSRPTFLIQPKRGMVIVAKMIVAALVGIGYGIVCALTAAAIMVPWLGAKGITIQWIDGGVLESLLSPIAVIAIFAVVGIGIGVLLRNQIAAVIGALGYFLVVETLIAIIPGVSTIYPYLPGAAANAITGGGRGTTTLLDPWAGGVVLLGWGLLFAVSGWIFTIRRDIP